MLFSLLALALSGCNDIPVKDGELPVIFTPTAQLFVGNYHGSLRNQTRNGRINQPRVDGLDVNLSLEGRHPRLTSSRDFIAEGCGSQTGKLLRLRYSIKETTESLEGDFEFDPGQCPKLVDDDTLHFRLTRVSSGKISLKTYVIIKYVRGYHRGRVPLNIVGSFLRQPE